MSAEPTWDSQIEASIAPPADTGAEASDTPEAPEPTPEAPAEAQPETPAEVVAAPSGDAAAGEGEAEPEEQPEEDDEEKNDPPELQALPSKSAQRRAARREMVERLKSESEPVRKFLDPTAPITAVGDMLEDLSKSRYVELTHDFFESHGDQYLATHRYKDKGLTVEEIDAAVERAAVAKQSGTPDVATPADSSYDPYSDPLVPEEVLNRLREADALKQTVEQLTKKVEDATGKVETFETKEQERERLQLEAESRAIEGEVFQAVFPVVGDTVKEYGLEENKDDPPLIAGLKEAGRELLLSNLDPVFMQDAENKKAVDRVKHWASKREKENALREVDALKVRSRAAAEAVRNTPKLDAVLLAIQQLSEKKAEKIKDRGKGQPPVPAGAPPGGAAIPKTEIKSWDDAFAAAGQ